MKPHRLTLTNELVHAYGLDKLMQMRRTQPCAEAELLAFHEEDYVAFLKRILPEDAILPPVFGYNSSLATRTIEEIRPELPGLYSRFNLSGDCPIFGGVFDFCRMYTGASLQAARHLTRSESEVVINWSGGLHHAKRASASGFCYINDIVLAILEMLRHYPRVLYIDIDVHHGDGVQEAFWSCDRVMTLSLHRYGDHFFPGTGGLEEQGLGLGKGFSLNVPLGAGIDDAGYAYVFAPILRETVSRFQPSAIVLQCGADSLRGDRLGCFNLSIKGHGDCVRMVQGLGLPLLVLGGGGYTIRNVSRCWAYETGLLVGKALENDLPEGIPFRHQFGPDYCLHPPITSLPKPIENENDRITLDRLIAKVLAQLKTLEGAPSVQWQELPPRFEPGEFEAALKVRLSDLSCTSH